ncbi:TolC family protein [Granulicella arctica]|uniref:TolC family protein n=1 Tax=Granulicella arctica TaxID=940613 RepID=UPI0021DFFF64|nr:TolC family protein [Granulicella arctica]
MQIATFLVAICGCCSTGARAQQSPAISIDLAQALSRAQSNEPAFAAASAANRVAALDRTIARNALLPSAIYHNQILYTQPNGATNQAGSAGTQSAPRFIANNAVHEYASQGIVSETIGLQQLTAVSRASAAAAVATAELEIARRGLVAAVVGLFYGSLAADRKLTVAERAAAEAASFTTLAQQREAAREGAHADVVKAQLQQQQRDRDLVDARLQSQRSRLELAVLLFPDPRTPYSLETPPSTPLATRDEVDAAATRANPELQSALASLRASSLDVRAARASYLPDLGLNFAYGIDAEHFATRGPQQVENLGYSASATLDIPIWDWLNTQHRIKQAEILRDTAKVSLSATQRRLIAQLDESYAEAAAAHDQLQSLDLSVTTAADSLRLTRLRYMAGEATALEIVDAQNSLTTAEIAREDGTVRYQAALASLQILTGTLS